MNRERPFVNVASAGLPAPAAQRASSWKRLLGPLAYAAGAVTAGLTAKPLTCLVDCDGRELLAGRGLAGDGRGVRRLRRGDRPGGPTRATAGSRWWRSRPGRDSAWSALAYRLRSGGVADHPRAYHTRCKTAEVQVPDCTRFNVDGELVTAGAARFTAEERAFRLVVG